MARRRYRLSHQALADLEEIADHLGDQNASAADRVLEELLRTFQSLAANPELGTRREDLYSGIRLFVPPKPAGNYAVFYYPVSDGVEVSDVIHAARDWVGLFSRGER